MIRELLKKIAQGQDVRKNLIALKAECKETAGKHAILYALNNQLQLFYGLLQDEDPKIRKNAALVLGQLGVQESLEFLYEAYVKEATLFVRSSYLAAMKELDFRTHLEDFEKRFAQIAQMEKTEQNKKHLLEESNLLQEMQLMMQGTKKHRFIGWDKPARIVLLTNRNFREITAEQLKSHQPRVFNAGVQARTTDLKAIYQVRTFSELLFVMEKKATLETQTGQGPDADAAGLAQQILDSGLPAFLTERHEGEAPFYFRIECKNKMDLKQKSIFTKKLANYLQEKSKGMLRNSTSHYEVELRLIENKTGNFNFMVKLYTYTDPRFRYRKEALATSIQPVNAALAVYLAKDYLREGAQVLDPFCGVGTMLIERSRMGKTGDLYGIDLYGKGIEAARRNAELANVKVNYINRDFFAFTHGYLFDEVITNLPRVMGQKTKEEIRELYRHFFEKIQEHLHKQGILVLYCYERELLKQTIPNDAFTVLKEFEISKKEGSYCLVLQYDK